MNIDAIRPAPLLPPGSLHEDDEDTVSPVSPQSFFPYPACWARQHSGIWEADFSKHTVEAQEVHLLFRFVHLQWNVFDEKIKKMCVIL